MAWSESSSIILFQKLGILLVMTILFYFILQYKENVNIFSPQIYIYIFNSSLKKILSKAMALKSWPWSILLALALNSLESHWSLPWS